MNKFQLFKDYANRITIRKGDLWCLCITLLLFLLCFTTTTPQERCTKKGYECIFPYQYLGKSYNECLPGSLWGPWCGIKKHVTKNSHLFDYDYCAPQCPEKTTFCTKEGYKCIFPFMYDEHNYTRCLPYNSFQKSGSWCPIVTNFENSTAQKKWGYCAVSCPKKGAITYSPDLEVVQTMPSNTTGALSALTENRSTTVSSISTQPQSTASLLQTLADVETNAQWTTITQSQSEKQATTNPPESAGSPTNQQFTTQSTVVTTNPKLVSTLSSMTMLTDNQNVVLKTIMSTSNQSISNIMSRTATSEASMTTNSIQNRSTVAPAADSGSHTALYFLAAALAVVVFVSLIIFYFCIRKLRKRKMKKNRQEKNTALPEALPLRKCNSNEDKRSSEYEDVPSVACVGDSGFGSRIIEK